MERLGRSNLRVGEILDRLAPKGYGLCFYARKTATAGATLALVRTSHLNGLYEQFRIGLLIGNHNRIWTSLWNTVIPTGNQWKGMFEVKKLENTRSNTYWFPIETEEDIIEWNSCVLEHASENNHEFANDTGPQLLKRTLFARHAADFYMSKIPECISNHEVFWRNQKNGATEDQRIAARTMMRSGLINIPYSTSDEEDLSFLAYQIAVYTIVLNSNEAVERGFFSSNIDPYKSSDLAWCIQILASKIYGHPTDNVITGVQ